MFKRLLVVLVLSFVIIGCKHQKTVNGMDSSVSIQESACEGTCPVYTMTIHSSGKANYNGVVHVNTIGDQEYTFKLEAVNALFEMLSEIEFSSLDELYDSSVMDLPETVITYKEHRIVIKDRRIIPDQLKDLLEELQKLSRSTGFIN